MTRKEEIKKAAQECKWISKSLNLQSAFTEGANWADKTMLDRAENYLRSKLDYRPILKEEYIHGEDYIRNWQEQSRLCNEFITAFRQAMEGGNDE